MDSERHDISQCADPSSGDESAVDVVIGTHVEEQVSAASGSLEENVVEEATGAAAEKKTADG